MGSTRRGAREQASGVLWTCEEPGEAPPGGCPFGSQLHAGAAEQASLIYGPAPALPVLQLQPTPPVQAVARHDLPDLAAPSALQGLQGWLVRQAVGGVLPLRRLWPSVGVEPGARTGRLELELVSHCWNYSHLLEFQLGSLAANPPREVDVTMTVYFCEEDVRTARLLELAGQQEIPNVTFCWRALPRELLFRRSIGRNHAALNTTADWIWFTDCDVLFGPGCLDSLGRSLQGRNDRLVFPAVERLTTLLADEALEGEGQPQLREPPAEISFVEVPVTKAKGPLQITHGDVARDVGYCRDLAVYQRPESAFAKCREDTAFRWLLGTQGVPVEVEGLSRIRHLSKGRYSGSATGSSLRSSVRRVQDWFRHPG